MTNLARANERNETQERNPIRKEIGAEPVSICALGNETLSFCNSQKEFQKQRGIPTPESIRDNVCFREGMHEHPQGCDNMERLEYWSTYTC